VEYTAIILKHISPHKIAMLDRERGRLDGIVLKPVPLGALLRYSIQKERESTLYLADWTITDLPFALARENIFFWHHVLELCFYFVPIASVTPQLFELCTFLYTVDYDTCWSTQSKKIYLFKLLTTIGMYPRLPHIAGEQLRYFLQLPLAAIGQAQMEEQHERKLDEWLRVCVSDHPAVTKFKTIHYLLTQAGCHE
jgi:hypothetical protein